MKQIVDKLNKIAKKINENVELSDRDLIIDSLDSITKAYGGTPNDSNLIVDKLEDIYNNIAPAVSGNIEITENGENINVAPYATATVNVEGEIPFIIPLQTVTTLSSGYRELPLGVNLEDLSVGDHAVLKVSGSYYGVPISGYIIGSVMDLTPGDEAITFAGNFGSNDEPMTVQVDVINTPGFSEYEWGILLLINNTQTAITDLQVSAVAW